MEKSPSEADMRYCQGKIFGVSFKSSIRYMHCQIERGNFWGIPFRSGSQNWLQNRYVHCQRPGNFLGDFSFKSGPSFTCFIIPACRKRLVSQRSASLHSWIKFRHGEKGKCWMTLKDGERILSILECHLINIFLVCFQVSWPCAIQHLSLEYYMTFSKLASSGSSMCDKRMKMSNWRTRPDTVTHWTMARSRRVFGSISVFYLVG